MAPSCSYLLGATAITSLQRVSVMQFLVSVAMPVVKRDRVGVVGVGGPTHYAPDTSTVARFWGPWDSRVYGDGGKVDGIGGRTPYFRGRLWEVTTYGSVAVGDPGTPFHHSGAYDLRCPDRCPRMR